MKFIIFLIAVLTVIGCGSNAVQPPSASTTGEQISRTMKDIIDAKEATERAAIEVKAMPDQPHKEAASTFLQAASKSLDGAIVGADKSATLAKKDSKEIERYRSEVATKIRGYAWPFLIGGFCAIAGGIVALRFGLTLGKQIAIIGGGSILAGILILSLANTVATIVSITTIIMTAAVVVVAVWFGWHVIVYIRRGMSITDAAGNAASDIGDGQVVLDKAKTN